MAMEVVNGFVCTSCADVERARKGVDPSPARAALDALAMNDTKEPRIDGPTVTFDGSLARPIDAVAPVGEPAAAENASLRTRKLDVLV